MPVAKAMGILRSELPAKLCERSVEALDAVLAESGTEALRSA
jgi:hypothetical protein